MTADPNGSASKWHQRSEAAGPLTADPGSTEWRLASAAWEVWSLDTAGGSRENSALLQRDQPCGWPLPAFAASSIEQVIDWGSCLQTGPSRYVVVLTMVNQRRAQGCEQGPASY